MPYGSGVLGSRAYGGAGLATITPTGIIASETLILLTLNIDQSINLTSYIDQSKSLTLNIDQARSLDLEL
jgi:hypothetical protein